MERRKLEKVSATHICHSWVAPSKELPPCVNPSHEKQIVRILYKHGYDCKIDKWK